MVQRSKRVKNAAGFIRSGIEPKSATNPNAANKTETTSRKLFLSLDISEKIEFGV